MAAAAVRRLGPFASGMAARKGEDPLTGLQRSQQPGPQGDAQFPTRGFREDIGMMNCEQTSFLAGHRKLWSADLTQRGHCTFLASSPWLNRRSSGHSCQSRRLWEQSLPKRESHGVGKGQRSKISPGIVQMKLHAPRRDIKKLRNILHRLAIRDPCETLPLALC